MRRRWAAIPGDGRGAAVQAPSTATGRVLGVEGSAAASLRASGLQRPAADGARRERPFAARALGGRWWTGRTLAARAVKHRRQTEDTGHACDAVFFDDVRSGPACR